MTVVKLQRGQNTLRKADFLGDNALIRVTVVSLEVAASEAARSGLDVELLVLEGPDHFPALGGDGRVNDPVAEASEGVQHLHRLHLDPVALVRNLDKISFIEITSSLEEGHFLQKTKIGYKIMSTEAVEIHKSQLKQCGYI